MRRLSTLLALAASIAALAPTAGAQSQLGRQDGLTGRLAGKGRQFHATPGLPPARGGATQTITQNSSQDIVELTGIACPTPPNSVYRVFDLSDYDLPTGLNVTEVGFGIEGTNGNTTSTLNLYRLNGPFVLANLTLVDSETVPLSAADDLTIREVPITGAFDSDDVIVVEWAIEGTAYFGGNAAPASAPTYLRSTGCSTPEPADISTLGDFPANHWVVNVTGTTTPVFGPSIALSPLSLAFGGAPLGDTVTRTVTVTRNGNEDVVITGITASGPGFAVDLTGTDLVLTDADPPTTFTVTFTPVAEGAATGSVSIAGNMAGSPRTVALTGTGVVPPPNDDFGDAEVIAAAGSVSGTNVLATLEAGETAPSCALSPATASVWYLYTPPEDGFLTVSLANSSFDTVLSFHDPSRVEFACNEDEGFFGPFTSLIENEPVPGGAPIYIRIDGYEGDQGDIGLDLSFTPGSIEPPANDDRANAVVITTNGTFTGSNLIASEEPGELEASCQGNSGTSVWWTFTPATAGTVSIDLAGSSFDTVLSLYQPGTTEIACNDDTDSGLQSVLTDVPIAAGEPVYVRIGGYADDEGTISFTFNYTGTLVAGEEGPSAAATALTAAPNPVRGTALVRLSVETAQDVTVAVYDVTGRQVATLFEGAVAVGQPVELTLDAAALPAGVYVVRAMGEGLTLTQRVTVAH